MKKLFLFVGITSILFFGALFATSQNQPEIAHDRVKFIDKSDKEIKESDMIFQTSLSSQCEAVRITTKSIYSHCGIIFKKEIEKALKIKEEYNQMTNS